MLTGKKPLNSNQYSECKLSPRVSSKKIFQGHFGLIAFILWVSVPKFVTQNNLDTKLKIYSKSLNIAFGVSIQDIFPSKWTTLQKQLQKS